MAVAEHRVVDAMGVEVRVPACEPEAAELGPELGTAPPTRDLTIALWTPAPEPAPTSDIPAGVRGLAGMNADGLAMPLAAAEGATASPSTTSVGCIP